LNHGTGIVKKFSRTFDHGPLLGHLAELARIKEAALKKGSFSSAVNAETNRGKAAGLYIDRKIIKTGKLEDLSEQELEAKMKKIIEDYSQILDVTPETELIEGDDKKD
jgi:CTP-dependent riboflavin kinase